MRKRTQKGSALQGRRVGHDVSPTQALSDWYRLGLADLLFQLEAEPLLNREQKLEALYAVIDNILPILLRMCTQVAGEILARSDPRLSLAGAAKQMRGAVRDLINLLRTVTVRQRGTRLRRRPH